MARVLERRRVTQPQVDLPADQRRANVAGAFALRAGRNRAVRNCCVVLVDDVATTGATLEACARVLRSAGAHEVRAITAARVPTGRPHRPLG
jgi:predicted amidophosphoribosyltransferase